MTPEEIKAIAEVTEAFVKSALKPVETACIYFEKTTSAHGDQLDTLASKLRDVVEALVAADGALAQRIAALEEGEPEATQPFVEIDPLIVEPDGYEADRAAFFGPKPPKRGLWDRLIHGGDAGDPDDRDLGWPIL